MTKTQDTNLFDDRRDSLKKKVLIGSFWLYVLQGLSMGLLIVQTIILARILAPEHFGIVGVFLIVSGALESFTQTGFTKGLIQRKEVDNDFLDTAWTVSVVRGAILFFLISMGSSFIVQFFDTPKALPVIRVLGFSMLLQGFSNTGTIYFSRDLDFFKQFLWKSSTFLANFIISVPLAFILHNEWALVWGMLAGMLAGVVFSFLLHPYRPKLRFEYGIFKELFRYGKWLFLSSVVVFFSKQGDKIIVVRLLDETLLGIYVIAWRFARIPELLTNPIPNALFPAYSKFQDNPRVLKEKYKQTLRVIGLFYIPVVGGMIVLAGPFIACLGERWNPAVIPMQILTAAVGIKVIIETSRSLFNATGRTSFNFKINCTDLIVVSIFVYPLVARYGIVGAALCYVLTAVADFILWKIEINKLIGFRIKDLGCLLFSTLSTLMMVGVIHYVGHWLNADRLGVFLCLIILGCAIYFSTGLMIQSVTGLNFMRDVTAILCLFKAVKSQNKDCATSLI